MTAMIRNDSFDRCDHHQGPNEIVQIHVLKPPKVRAEKKRSVSIHGNFHVPNFATEKRSPVAGQCANVVHFPFVARTDQIVRLYLSLYSQFHCINFGSFLNFNQP